MKILLIQLCFKLILMISFSNIFKISKINYHIVNSFELNKRIADLSKLEKSKHFEQEAGIYRNFLRSFCKNKNGFFMTHLKMPNLIDQNKKIFLPNIYKRTRIHNIQGLEEEYEKSSLRLKTNLKSKDLDYFVLAREITFNISDKLGCSSIIKEKITVQALKAFNLIEHWILHNNFDNLEIRNIYSPDAKINFYFFNKKFSLLSVYFDPYSSHKKFPNMNQTQHNNGKVFQDDPLNQKDTNSFGEYSDEKFEDMNQMKRNFTFEFEYQAFNLILTHIGNNNVNGYSGFENTYSRNRDIIKIERTNFNDLVIKNEKIIIEPHTKLHFTSEESYNSLVWKLFNKNYFENINNTKINIIFDMGVDFVNSPVLFEAPLQMKFKKSLEIKQGKSLVKFSAVFNMEPQEVTVLNMKFPLFFKECSTAIPSFFMIAIFSIFLIFLIIIVYIIFSTFYFNTVI